MEKNSNRSSIIQRLEWNKNEQSNIITVKQKVYNQRFIQFIYEVTRSVLFS